MIRILSIILFLFINLNIYAQCISLQSGSACLNEDGETNLNFIPSNGCGSSNWS